MAGNNLFKKAAALKKAHPKKYSKFTDYVKEVARKARKKTKRVVKSVRKKVKRTKVSGPGYGSGHGGAFVNTVGTISGHLSAAKNLLYSQLGNKEIQKAKATTKRDKSKIQKDISEIKSRIRRLSN